jgi:hypothetical protein
MDPFRLGVSEGELIDLSSQQEKQFHCQNLTAQASHMIRIFTSDLDHDLYDQQDFIEILSRFARSSRFAEVRILLRNIEPAVKRGHAVLELSRRLSSKVTIRQLIEPTVSFNESYLLADSTGLFSHTAQRQRATANYNSRYRVKMLCESFDQHWQNAQLPEELRTLAL